MYNIVLIDLKQLLTHNNQKQKDKSSHLGFGVFSDRRVVRLISRLITVIEQSRSFWRSCQSRNPVRPSVHRSHQSRSLRKEPRTGGFTPKKAIFPILNILIIFDKNDYICKTLQVLCNLKMQTPTIFIISNVWGFFFKSLPIILFSVYGYMYRGLIVFPRVKDLKSGNPNDKDHGRIESVPIPRLNLIYL